MEVPPKATLTFCCDVADLISMWHLIVRFMPRRPGSIIEEPRVDQETGAGYVTVAINTSNTSNMVKWSTKTEHTSTIINELIKTRLEPGLPTKAEWARSLIDLGIATRAELHFDNGCMQEWTLDIATGTITGEEGKVLYQPGQEG